MPDSKEFQRFLDELPCVDMDESPAGTMEFVAEEPGHTFVLDGESPEDADEAADREETTEPSGARYAFVEQLGIGGMGEVWRVWDHLLQRTVALKTIKPERMGSTRVLERFFNEVRVGAGLQHPNIAGTYEVGRLEDGRPYFTMREVQGRTFSDRLEEASRALQSGRLSRTEEYDLLQEHLQIFLRVCETVAYAHSRNTVHRDLKPENIMTGRFGEVQVLDWGIALLLGEVEIPPRVVRNERLRLRSGMASLLAGTPHYMAPEQAQSGSTIRLSADVYSLGAILFEILSGAPPFSGFSGEEVLRQARVSDPAEFSSDSLYSIRTAALRELSLHCMAIAEGARPSASELCERLRELLVRFQRYQSSEQAYSLAAVEKRQEILIQREVDAHRTQAEAALNAPNLSHSWECWSAYQQALSRLVESRQRSQDHIFDALSKNPVEMAQQGQAMEELVVEWLRAEHKEQNRRAGELKEIFDAVLDAIEPLEARRWQSLKETLSQSVSFKTLSGASPLRGREEVVTELVARLRKPRGRVGLTGPFGIGKSRLQHEVVARFEVEGTPVLSCSLEWLTDARSIEERIRQQLSRWTEVHGEVFDESQQRLLVLESVGCTEEVYSTITRVVADWVELRLLVVGRGEGMDHLESVEVPPMDMLEAVELFETCALAAVPGFALAEADWPMVLDLVKASKGLPLTLEMTAQQLQFLQLQELHARIVGEGGEVDLMGPGSESMHRVLQWTWNELSDREQKDLLGLSAFAGSFRLESLQAVLSLEPGSKVTERIASLARHSLLEVHTNPQGIVLYRLSQVVGVLLDLVHSALGEEELALQEEARDRHRTHYTERGRQILRRQGGLDGADRILPMEEPNLSVAGERAEPTDAAVLALALSESLERRGLWSSANEVIEQVLEREGLTSIDRRRLQLYSAGLLSMVGQGGRAQSYLQKENLPAPEEEAAEPARARLRQENEVDTGAETFSSEANWTDLPPEPLLQRAKEAVANRQYGVPKTMLEHALSGLEPDSRDGLELEILLALMDLLLKRGTRKASSHLDVLPEYFERADQLIARGEDERLAARLLRLRTDHYLYLNRFDDALHCGRRAVEAYTVLGEHQAIADCHSSIANAALGEGFLQQAAESYWAAWEVGQTKLKRPRASALANYAYVKILQGDHLEALAQLHQARKTAVESQSRLAQSFVSHNIGRCHFELGDWKAALEEYGRATREIANEPHQYRGYFMAEYAEVLALLGRRAAAEKALREARLSFVTDLSTRTEQHSLVGVARFLLGDVEVAQRELVTIERLSGEVNYCKNSPTGLLVQRLSTLLGESRLVWVSQEAHARAHQQESAEELDEELLLEADRWFRLAEDERNLSAYPEARAMYHQSLIRCRAGGDVHRLTRSLHGLAMVEEVLSGHAVSRQLLESALHLRERHCPGASTLGLQSALATCFVQQGLPRKAVAIHKTALEQLDGAQDSVAFLRSLNNLMHASVRLGVTVEERAAYQERLSQCTGEVAPQSVVASEINMAVVDWCLGEKLGIERQMKQVIARYASSEKVYVRSHAYGWLARLYQERGDLVAALALYQELEEITRGEARLEFHSFFAEAAACWARAGDLVKGDLWLEKRPPVHRLSLDDKIVAGVAAAQIHAVNGRKEPCRRELMQLHELLDSLDIEASSLYRRLVEMGEAAIQVIRGRQ